MAALPPGWKGLQGERESLEPSRLYADDSSPSIPPIPDGAPIWIYKEGHRTMDRPEAPSKEMFDVTEQQLYYPWGGGPTTNKRKEGGNFRAIYYLVSCAALVLLGFILGWVANG